MRYYSDMDMQTSSLEKNQFDAGQSVLQRLQKEEMIKKTTTDAQNRIKRILPHA